VPIHIVELADRDLSLGAGWARKSWEQETLSLGRQSLSDLIEAERVQCPAIEDPMLLVGDPVQEIVRIFSEQACDLLVVGIPYRGLGPVSLCKRFSQRVEKGHQELPALLVRCLRPIRRVLAMTDGGKRAENSLALMAKIEGPGAWDITLVGLSSEQGVDPQAEVMEIERGAAILKEKGIRPKALKASSLSKDEFLARAREADLVIYPWVHEHKRYQYVIDYIDEHGCALLGHLGDHTHEGKRA
jgi:hypothetical protein